MGIKETLESEQRKLSSDFVSIKTVIEVLADDQQCSAAEVAKFLLNKIETFGHASFPELLTIDPVRLRVVTEVCSEPLMPLLDIAAGHPIDDDINDRGWSRVEISRFILMAGLSPVPCFPQYEPNKVVDLAAPDHCPAAFPDVAGRVQLAFNDDSYSTPLLELQKAAIFEFYSQPRVVDPKKNDVVEWLFAAAKELDLPLSDNVADAMFTIIKPKDHNPKKRRG